METQELIGMLSDLRRARTPGQLVVQLTDRCNARCPQCGMRVTETFRRSTLPLDDVRRIVDAAAKRGVQAISFTGGEPMLMARELALLIRHAGSAGIRYIRTGTNGFFLKDGQSRNFEDKIKKTAELLAETPLRNFWISVDSSIPEVHERMRGFPGVVRGMARAIPIFHASGIYPSANLGINRNIGGTKTAGLLPSRSFQDGDYLDTFEKVFSRAFRDFYRFVIDLGFTIVNCCYPMSIGGDDKADDLRSVYGANSQDRVIRFSAQEKQRMFKALLEAIPAYRSQVRVFSPRASLYAMAHPSENGHGPTYPCRGGIDYFFIDAKDGSTYPCGYRGNENLGKYWEMNPKGLDQTPFCKRCEWECFRDPSELFGPMITALTAPLTFLKRIRRNPFLSVLWLEDLNYYRACDLFNGRRPPNYERLRRFRVGRQED